MPTYTNIIRIDDKHIPNRYNNSYYCNVKFKVSLYSYMHKYTYIYIQVYQCKSYSYSINGVVHNTYISKNPKVN